jgi:hypothetical protein
MRGLVGPRALFWRVSRVIQGSESIESRLDALKILAAKGLIETIRAGGIRERLSDVEFQVFSQFGDDGIIQYLLQHVPIERDSFVEFGVENYTESNTRFLLLNNNWCGLVMDGSEEHVAYIQRDPIYWRHELTAKCAFIDASNIDRLLSEAGMAGPLGILHIDIDGNDYWVWNAMTVVDPAIVIVEYNAVFGKDHAITIPYDPLFQRTRAHASNLYWGASLKSFCQLAERKGFAFVGCNGAGNNAYFVRKDLVGGLKVHSAESGYVASRFRDSRRPDGTLSYLAGEERALAIADMMVHDLERDRQVRLGDLRGPG